MWSPKKIQLHHTINHNNYIRNGSLFVLDCKTTPPKLALASHNGTPSHIFVYFIILCSTHTHVPTSLYHEHTFKYMIKMINNKKIKYNFNCLLISWLNLNNVRVCIVYLCYPVLSKKCM